MKTLLWLAMAALTGAGFGAPMENGVVIAVQVKGTVEVLRGKDTPPAPVANNDSLSAGDTIETKAQSSCVLVLPNGSTVAVRERTRLAIALAMQERYTDAELIAANNSKREPSKYGRTQCPGQDCKIGNAKQRRHCPPAKYPAEIGGKRTHASCAAMRFVRCVMVRHVGRVLTQSAAPGHITWRAALARL